MFVQCLAENPHHFVYVVVTLVFSIVLHELAHGWAAIRAGDRTPIELGHMTIDPRVHMGWPSLLMVFAFGIGYGAMPVDPRRFRHRHGEAFVAAAGPLCNLLLAIAALTGLAIWNLATDLETASVEGGNLRAFLWTFGYVNLALAVFNLLPLPPLDGSTVLASLHRGYRDLLARIQQPVVFLAAFILVWALLGDEEHGIYATAGSWSGHYVRWIYSLAGR